MMISRDNYEIAFIDYLDGNLPDEKAEEVRAFLLENPDLNDELAAMSGLTVPSDAIVFEEKDTLKNIVFTDEVVFNESCVASIEGDLSEQEELQLQQFINSSAEHAREYKLFELSKINADKSIVFDDKETLYKKAIIWWMTPQFSAIAAAVFVALILMGTLENRMGFLNNNYMASGISYHLNGMENFNQDQQTYTELDKAESISIANESIPPEKINTAIRLEKTEPKLVNKEVKPIEPIFAKLQNKQRQLPTHIYIYKPQLALSKTQVSASSKKMSTIDKVNQAGRTLLTDNNGKLKNIPREDIQTGLLAALKRATNQRVNFETNEAGKVRKLNLNGDLLAFSIPISKD